MNMRIPVARFSSLVLVTMYLANNVANAFAPNLLSSSSLRSPIKINANANVNIKPFQRSARSKNMPISMIDSSSIMQAVETFDGSTIVDPVVVSGAFWSRLQSNIISVIIGQFLAAIAFSILSYVFSTQLSRIGDYFSQNVFNESVVKNNVGAVAETIKERSQSPTIAPDFGKLLLCLVIDTLGTSSELIPFFGELTDFAYAPAAALALRSIFQGSNVVFALEFIEEILPFTDILPLATICWIIQTYYGDSGIAKTLQIGVYGKNTQVDDVIDGRVIDVTREDRR